MHEHALFSTLIETLPEFHLQEVQITFHQLQDYKKQRNKTH